MPTAATTVPPRHRRTGPPSTGVVGRWPVRSSPALLSLTGLVVADVLLGPGDVPASAAGARTLAPRRTVVARPGDSLWSIAEAEYARSPDAGR